MRFDDFLVFDAAATAIYDDPSSQRHCRDCLRRLAEMVRTHPGKFMVEAAARRDARKGVAFKSKTLDDLEHGVFSQRLAQRLWKKPDESQEAKRTRKPSSTGTRAYGDFLRQSVRQQGDVLGDMNWEQWEVCKAALELGGIDPAVFDDPNKTPAERLALVGKINWASVTLPALKAKLGDAFRVPDDWKREFGIARLKKIKAAVEQGQPLTDPQDRRLLGVWRTLEVQLGGEDSQPNQILPSGPTTDVGMTRMPMSPDDRRRFYSALTGTNESVALAQAPLRLSAQSAYDNLVKYGMEIISDDEAKDLYLTRILNGLRNNNAFVPSSPQGSEPDKKRWHDSAARSWGGFLPAARFYDPSNDPGVAQRLSGMTTRGFRTRLNPSGRRVPYAYNEPEEFQWPADKDDMPKLKYTIDAPSAEVPDENINAFYRSRTPEAAAAVQQELEEPARDAVGWLRKRGWIDDPSKVDDFVQDVILGMMNRTAAVPNWRSNIGFRRTTAAMLARRFASQGWPSAAKERTGQMRGGDDEPDPVQTATGSNRQGGEDQFSRVQAGAARARAAIQKAIASVLDIDTTAMGDDEAQFVDSIDSLSDPTQAARALHVLDRLSTQHSAVLPQVRKAIDRIHRHLDPLLGKVR